MSNIITYLSWRGDLSFANAPLNEVDSLILTQLGYLDFDGIVPSVSDKGTITLQKAAETFLWRMKNRKKRLKDYPILIRDCVEILQAMMYTERFQNCRLTKYVNRVNTDEEYQFSAMKILPGDGSIFIAFRGTDSSVAGWKENFNMSYMVATPGQRMAVDYVKMAAAFGNKPLRFGGHSKGGNLAVFAALKSGIAIKRRLIEIYNFDGPGFTKEMVSPADYKGILENIHTIIPQSSMIGILLQHMEKYDVIESSQKGLMQHRAITWNILGNSFIHLSELSADSIFWDETFKKWIDGMNLEERKDFVNALFAIFDGAGIEDVENIKRLTLRRLLHLLRAVDHLTEEEKRSLTKSVKKLADEIEYAQTGK